MYWGVDVGHYAKRTRGTEFVWALGRRQKPGAEEKKRGI